jgi:hypothetical protein
MSSTLRGCGAYGSLPGGAAGGGGYPCTGGGIAPEAVGGGYSAWLYEPGGGLGEAPGGGGKLFLYG